MSGFSVSDNDMDLPPGFRFHPTDEELITHYLTPKVLDTMFSAAAIGEVDLNSVEPWDLPWKAKMGEKEWYFFCVRDRKYPTGMRTNRATFAGYWKATGKDKEIFKAKRLVGMKKTLVFYKGRAPRGEKTSWVMHEFYRLEGMQNNLPKTAKNEWVICRVFKKSSGGKKIPISSLIKSENCGENSKMPPLMDISQASHVPCFSNSVEDEKPRNSESSGALSNHQLIMPELGVDSGMMMMQDHSILKLLLGNNQNSEVGLRPCDDDDDQQFLITSAAGAVDLDCLWNYHY